MASVGRLRHARHAFTLVEIALVLGVIGILAATATSSFFRFQERARGAQVILDLDSISKELDGFEIRNGSLPATLAELDPVIAAMLDNWGNPYQYVPVEGTPTGKLRKDKFLVPINSDYDLYSKGPDGKSTPPLTAKSSRDDIIRAGNGSYYGRADGY